MVIRRDPSRASESVAMSSNGPGTATAYELSRQLQNQSIEHLPGHVRQLGETRALESPQPNLAVPGPSGLPPSYADSVAGGPTASIASGRSASDNKSSTGSVSDSDSDAHSADFDVESLQDDEEDWALDEAVPDPPSYEETEGPRRTSDDLVQDVLATSQSLVRTERACEPLPCPVVIPQRRPGDKGRGFVRAYAPVLANNGIMQEQFLAFLKSFHKASLTSPIFIAVQVTPAIASFAPGVIAMAVASALNVAERAARDTRYLPRANHFLDRMNEEIFRPAGLYAMVVKYKQGSSPSRNTRSTPVGAELGIGTEKINLVASHAVAKATRPSLEESGRTLKNQMQNLHMASHTTAGAVELPQAAPLIFPYLDRAMDREAGSTSTQNTVNNAGDFLQDYKDRRAQNDVALSGDQLGSKSRVVDNGPLNIPGDTLSARRDQHLDKYTYKLEKKLNKHMTKSQEKLLKYEQRVSEGRPLSRSKQMKYERHSRKLDFMAETRRNLLERGSGQGALAGSSISTTINAYNEKPTSRPSHELGSDPSLRKVDSASSGYSGTTLTSHNSAAARHQSSIEHHRAVRAAGPVRRVMKEDVLYLMIVNMPSDTELTEARDLLGLPW